MMENFLDFTLIKMEMTRKNLLRMMKKQKPENWSRKRNKFIKSTTNFYPEPEPGTRFSKEPEPEPRPRFPQIEVDYQRQSSRPPFRR